MLISYIYIYIQAIVKEYLNSICPPKFLVHLHTRMHFIEDGPL